MRQRNPWGITPIGAGIPSSRDTHLRTSLGAASDITHLRDTRAGLGVGTVDACVGRGGRVANGPVPGRFAPTTPIIPESRDRGRTNFLCIALRKRFSMGSQGRKAGCGTWTKDCGPAVRGFPLSTPRPQVAGGGLPWRYDGSGGVAPASPTSSRRPGAGQDRPDLRRSRRAGTQRGLRRAGFWGVWPNGPSPVRRSSIRWAVPSPSDTPSVSPAPASPAPSHTSSPAAAPAPAPAPAPSASASAKTSLRSSNAGTGLVPRTPTRAARIAADPSRGGPARTTCLDSTRGGTQDENHGN